jgi:hypothetical protein
MFWLHGHFDGFFFIKIKFLINFNKFKNRKLIDSYTNLFFAGFSRISFYICSY